MPDGSSYAVFVCAAVVLVFVPGPAVLYIVAQSIGLGRRQGVASAVGVAGGGLVHVAAAAIGLSSLLVTSAVAFGIVKYAGAGYLVFLGLRMLLQRGEAKAVSAGAPKRLRRVLAEGVVVNVLNPKTALFFFAFLPQFVDPDAGSVALQIAFLGLTFVAIALVSDTAYALATGTAAGFIRRKPRVMRAQRYLSGSVLLGLGVATAASGSRFAESRSSL